MPNLDPIELGSILRCCGNGVYAEVIGFEYGIAELSNYTLLLLDGPEKGQQGIWYSLEMWERVYHDRCGLCDNEAALDDYLCKSCAKIADTCGL